MYLSALSHHLQGIPAMKTIVWQGSSSRSDTAAGNTCKLCAIPDTRAALLWASEVGDAGLEWEFPVDSFSPISVF